MNSIISSSSAPTPEAQNMIDPNDLPTRLPAGIAEFDAWANDVIQLAGAPNNDSVKFSLAVMILHAGQDEDALPKNLFAKRLRKAMANQVVSQIINDLKAKQDAEQEALKKQAAEVIAPTVEAAQSDGPKE